MAYHIEFLADVALADIAYRVTADSVVELLAGTADALTQVMVEKSTIGSTRSLDLDITGESLDELLHEWLSQIVYLKDAQSFLLKAQDLKIADGPPLHLSGKLHGDTIDPDRQTFGQDVKAITYHMFEVGQTDGGYFAQVVLDI